MRITPSRRRRTGVGVLTTLLAISLTAVAGPGGGEATAAPGRVDPTFGLAVIPDTQTEVTDPGDTRFRERTEWLVSQRQELDLRYVSHVGDVVNWGWLDPSQYAVADDAIGVLDAAQVPYSLTVGNHDTRAVGVGGLPYQSNPDCVAIMSAAECNYVALGRRTDEFNATFPVSRVGGLGGTFEPGKIDNNFATFSAGGVNWMVLTLEPWPRLSAVLWARLVVASHPRHNVIVQTHSYLTSIGGIENFTSTAAMTSPQYLYDNLISRYPNIKFVFSGHTGNDATRVDTGASGNRIVSLLSAFHSPAGNPVRLLTVDTNKKTLATWIQTPRTGQRSATKSFTGLSFVKP